MLNYIKFFFYEWIKRDEFIFDYYIEKNKNEVDSYWFIYIIIYFVFYYLKVVSGIFWVI